MVNREEVGRLLGRNRWWEVTSRIELYPFKMRSHVDDAAIVNDVA